MHHHGRPSPSLYLLLHIWPILDILPKVANVATDFLVRFQREWDNRYEAKGKPLPALHDSTREVTTILTLYSDMLGAREV